MAIIEEDDAHDYEHIYVALEALAKTVRFGPEGMPERDAFKTVSRRVKLFHDVDKAAMQPACYQAEHDEDQQPNTSTPGKVILSASWIIYFASSDLQPGAVTQNRILRGVRRALRSLPTDPGYSDRRNTLGGLVYYARIEGKIFKDPGDIDDQGMLIVPIKILVP